MTQPALTHSHSYKVTPLVLLQRIDLQSVSASAALIFLKHTLISKRNNSFQLAEILTQQISNRPKFLLYFADTSEKIKITLIQSEVFVTLRFSFILMKREMLQNIIIGFSLTRKSTYINLTV
jgi:hypothetical protein